MDVAETANYVVRGWLVAEELCVFFVLVELLVVGRNGLVFVDGGVFFQV